MMRIIFHDNEHNPVVIDAETWALDDQGEWFEFSKDGKSVLLANARGVLAVLSETSEA